MNALNELISNSKTAKNSNSELAGSSNKFLIVESHSGSYFLENDNGAYQNNDGTPGVGSGGTIFMNIKNPAKLPTQKGHSEQNSPIELAHELFGHGLDANRGTMVDGGSQPIYKGLKPTEIFATHEENKIRGEMGIPLRTNYNDAPLVTEMHKYDINNLHKFNFSLLKENTNKSLYYDYKYK